ncbi:FCS-Like Zinc finger 17-like [Mercurialis annua]|uniref:FCS-Like Zinc finger 17-like n=1 Tax=Mercurialis annua TaxID=3986 RepID=UPI00215E762C|nr:FCS-Like Zinc finger 17-like [Mercurialis annua]
MLAKFKNPFELLIIRSQASKMGLVGLQTLMEISSQSNPKSNIVIKSSIRKPNHQHHQPGIKSCYLKTCYLCNKILSPDKDIYMYRGDEGYCSIECRNRQIALDEMRELEESVKKMRKSYNSSGHCTNSAGRNETRLLLEDLVRRHNPVVAHDHHQNHWAIVS